MPWQQSRGEERKRRWIEGAAIVYSWMSGAQTMQAVDASTAGLTPTDLQINLQSDGAQSTTGPKI